MRLTALVVSALASSGHAWHNTVHQCSCLGNWPRQGLWAIGSEMMDNGLNFTDFDEPWESPVYMLHQLDVDVFESMSRSMKDFSNMVDIDMDLVYMSIMKQIKINGEDAKKTIEDMTYALAKIIGSPAHAQFYKESIESMEKIESDYSQIMQDMYTNPDYTSKMVSWVDGYGDMIYVWNATSQSGYEVPSMCWPNSTFLGGRGEEAICDNKSWEQAFEDLMEAFMTNNLNRESVTEFITFFRQFMIDFFKAQVHEAMIEDGMKWVEPILRADCWENLDNLMADEGFKVAVKRFEGMIWMLSRGYHWDDKDDMAALGMMMGGNNNMTNDEMKSRKRRSHDELIGDLLSGGVEDMLNEILDFLPSEVREFIMPFFSRWQSSPFYQIQEHIMQLNQSHIDPAMQQIGYAAWMAWNDVNNFEEPIQYYMQAQQTLMTQNATQAIGMFLGQIDWMWMEASDYIENGELLPFKIDELMELVWELLNSEGIVEVNKAQDYFGWYWFEKVSAEKHVDVLMAVNDLVEVVIGGGLEDLPMFVQDVMNWLEGNDMTNNNDWNNNNWNNTDSNNNNWDNNDWNNNNTDWNNNNSNNTDWNNNNWNNTNWNNTNWNNNDSNNTNWMTTVSRKKRAMHGNDNVDKESLKDMKPDTMFDMMMEMPRGCACNPMDRSFSMEGKMEVFKEQMMEQMMNDTKSPGSESGSESGSDSGHSSHEGGSSWHDEHEHHCPEPIVPNKNIINMDGTVRPENNPAMCAATKSLKKNAAVFWVNCEQGRNMSYYMNFTAEYHSFSNQSVSFDDKELYPSVQGVELWMIQSADHHDRCWTIQKHNKATGKSSVVYLKKCEVERLAGRQLWAVMGGHILLADESNSLAMNHKWRSFIGIPYLGEGQKLKTRRVFDIALGGHQRMVDQYMEPEMHSPSQSPSGSPSGSPGDSSSADSEKDEMNWPACILVGNEAVISTADAMFQAEGHDHYNDCSVLDFDEAARFFGKEPGTVYPECMFLGVADIVNHASEMFEKDDDAHRVFNGCKVISYDLLKSLGN